LAGAASGQTPVFLDFIFASSASFSILAALNLANKFFKGLSSSYLGGGGDSGFVGDYYGQLTTSLVLELTDSGVAAAAALDSDILKLRAAKSPSDGFAI
jgi:hypothetical protein